MRAGGQDGILRHAASLGRVPRPTCTGSRNLKSIVSCMCLVKVCVRSVFGRHVLWRHWLQDSSAVRVPVRRTLFSADIHTHSASGPNVVAQRKTIHTPLH